MRVLVTGSREWTDALMVYSVLDGLYREHGTGPLGVMPSATAAADAVRYSVPDFVLIHGDNPNGADAITRRWAGTSHNLGLVHIPVPARWDEHDYDGTSGVKCWHAPTTGRCRAAGPRRNQRMLTEHKPELVIAFKDNLDPTLRHGGTEDMMNRAKHADVDVWHLRHA